MLEHFIRRLGDKPLSQITLRVIEDCYDDIRSTGELGDTSIQHLRRAVKLILAKACDYGLFEQNPCNLVPAPKSGDPHRRSLNSKQVMVLTQKLDESEREVYSQLNELRQRPRCDREWSLRRNRAIARMGLFVLACR